MRVPTASLRRMFSPLAGRVPARKALALLLIDPMAHSIQQIEWNGDCRALVDLLAAPDLMPVRDGGAADLLSVRLHVPALYGPHLLFTLAAAQAAPALARFEMLPHGGLFGGRGLVGASSADGTLAPATIGPERLARLVGWRNPPRDTAALRESDDGLGTLMLQVDAVLATRMRDPDRPPR